MMASEDSLYQENRAYQYTVQHHPSLWQSEQEQLVEAQAAGTSTVTSASSSVAEPTRSTPIAIVRAPSSGNRSLEEPAGFDTDDFDDDDDDLDGVNSGVIDMVERDAIRLRKKYGDRVIAASYQPGMMDAATDPSVFSKTMLKAPYLGSLSRSHDFLTSSLPPMKLSDDAFGSTGEPPAEITSYGSLRESHQRGKFLDGPSSYREPTSGQVRRLSRGNRFRSSDYSSSQPQSLSIGERLQQSRKLKEINQKKKKKEEPEKGDKKAAAGVSSLSTMMDKASVETETDSKEEKTAFEHFQLSSAATLSNEGMDRSAFVPDGLEDSDHQYDPPNMMSTSLTAFEILKTNNKSGGGYQYNHSQRFAQQQQEQQQRTTTILSSPAIVAPVVPLPVDEDTVREQGFQPLARSLSDPTPHHLQRSPLLSPTLEQLNSPHSTLAPANPPSMGNSWAPSAYSIGVDHHAPGPYGYSTTKATDGPSETLVTPVNPDTDAAFDMDME